MAGPSIRAVYNVVSVVRQVNMALVLFNRDRWNGHVADHRPGELRQERWIDLLLS